MTDRLQLIRQAVLEVTMGPPLPPAPQDYKPGKDHPWWHPSAKPVRSGPPTKGKKSRARPPSKIQTVILHKKDFKTKASARAWLKNHDFKRTLVETKTSWRARQLDSKMFKSGTLKTVKLTKGVKAVTGRKK